MCGQAADRRLAAVATDRVDSDDALRGKVSVDSYYHALQRQIADHALDQGKAVDDALVRTMLAAAKSEVMTKLQTSRYYFPVFCIHQQGLDEFQLGGVSFIHTEKFFKERREDWNAAIEKSKTDARAA